VSDNPNPIPEGDNSPANPATLEEALPILERLRTNLSKSRADVKVRDAKHAEFRRALTAPLGLPPDASFADVSAKVSNLDGLVAERTAALKKSADDAAARATRVENEWNAHRIENAIAAAVAGSGMLKQHAEDAANMLRPLLSVKDGRVVTRDDAPNAIPGATPEQLIALQVKAGRPHWWPANVGGGAMGSAAHIRLADTSCFNPRSPAFNITEQHRFARAHGSAAALEAMRKYGGGR
jgi:hypothetical protein